MIGNTAKIVFIFFLFIVINGCSKKTDNVCTVVIAKDYAGEAIVIGKDECIAFEMESQLSTGYRWQYTIKENPGLLAQSGYKVQTLQEKIVGGMDRETFSFKAVKPGNVIVMFDYIRSFDKNPHVVKHSTFNVIVSE